MAAFDCDLCEREFATQGSLNQHVRTVHRGERHYHCRSCKLDFRNFSSLQRHQTSQHHISFTVSVKNASYLFDLKWIQWPKSKQSFWKINLGQFWLNVLYVKLIKNGNLSPFGLSKVKILGGWQCAQCGNYGNSLSRIFGKNSVKVTVLLNKLLKSWFDEKKIDERELFVFTAKILLQNFRESNGFTK